MKIFYLDDNNHTHVAFVDAADYRKYSEKYLILSCKPVERKKYA